MDRCCCGHSLGQSKQRLAIKPRATVATCKLVRCSRSGNVVDALHKFASGGSLRRTMQTECARAICRYVRQFAACRTRPFDDWPVIRDTTHQIRGASISALRIGCCTEGRGGGRWINDWQRRIFFRLLAEDDDVKAKKCFGRRQNVWLH